MAYGCKPVDLCYPYKKHRMKEGLIRPIGSQLILGAPQGILLFEAKNVFAKGIGMDIGQTNRKLFARIPQAVGGRLVNIGEIVSDATPQEIFQEISKRSEKPLLTQEQIVHYAEQHEDVMRSEGYGTLAFFQEQGITCYIYMYKRASMVKPEEPTSLLSAIVYPSLAGGAYHGKFRHQVLY